MGREEGQDGKKRKTGKSRHEGGEPGALPLPPAPRGGPSPPCFPASVVPLLGSAGRLTLTVKPQACRHAHMHPAMQACMHLSFGTTVYSSQERFSFQS